MSLFRVPVPAFVFSVGLVWLLCCGLSPGAELPRLNTSVVYIGTVSKNQESCRVRLYFGDSGAFSLREELLLASGKLSGWEATGLWHQIRDGAFVQLSNNSGLYRLLNVGGTGNLYLGMQFSNGEQGTVILRPQKALPPEYEVSGLLRLKAGKLLLEDEDSGLSHPVLPGDTLAAFLKDSEPGDGAALPVRARVAEEPESGLPPALHVRDIQRIPTEKRRAVADLAGVFLENVAKKRWKLTKVGRDTPPFACQLFFLPGRGRHEGRVDCFDGSRQLSGGYTLWNGELTLSVPGAGEPLAGLLARVRAWKLAGEVLELWDGNMPLALLEAAP